MFERNKIDNVEHSAVAVELTTVEGEAAKGKMFIPMGRNIFEVLNGAQTFLEFEPFGGERTYVAKAAIRNVRIMPTPRAPSLTNRLRETDGFDPYSVLGLPTQAPFEDVKAAFHKLSKLYHPDRYAGAELPDEVREYLAQMARRVNAAYTALEAPRQKSRLAAAQRAMPIYESGGPGAR